MNINILTLLLLLPGFAWAYQCPLEEAYLEEIVYKKYQAADLVAILKPTKIENYELEDEFSSYNLIYAKVIKTWKNADQNEIIVKDINSMISGYLPFDVGKEYIVYAYGPDENGFYEAYTCELETLGRVTRKQTSILEKIPSNKLKVSSYYNVFQRLESFIRDDLIENINVNADGDVVHVTIELSELSEAEVSDKIMRFIKQECAALGIENVGKFILSNKEGKKFIRWDHPKSPAQ